MSVAYYGWLRDQHGLFLQVDGVVSFRDSATETWQPVDLPTLHQHATLNGRVDLTDATWAGRDLVYEASRTLQHRKAAA